MKPEEHHQRLIVKAIDDLKTMPSLWQSEPPTGNAWEMLVGLWPDNEPGLGIWDEICAILKRWILGLLEEEPLETIREHWEEKGSGRWEFDTYRAEAEEAGEEPLYPPTEELCCDLADVLLDEVLIEAESESIRRDGAEWQ